MRMREGARRRARLEKGRVDGDRQGRRHAPRKLRFMRFDDHHRRDGGRVDLHDVPSAGHGLRRRYEKRFSRRGAVSVLHGPEVSLTVVSTLRRTGAPVAA
jgi:hypothetical protein